MFFVIMTIKRMHDHYNMGFFERRRHKEMRYWYVSEDFHDVMKVSDHIHSGIIFDSDKIRLFDDKLFGTNLAYLFQTYHLFIDQKIQLEKTSEGIYVVRKIVDGSAYDWLVE